VSSKGVHGRGSQRVLIGVAVAAALWPASAGAASLEVTLTGDPLPNGCSVGGCSLREAVIAANARPGPNSVSLAAGRTYRLALGGTGEDGALTGDLDVAGPLTISTRGRGRATIDAARIDRVLDLRAPARLERLRIVNGLAPVAEQGRGAAVRATDARLELRKSAIVDNDGPADAIALLGTGGVTARESSISFNAGNGVTDLGGGGFRGAHVEISNNLGTGVQGYGAGGVGIYHATMDGNRLRAVQEFDGGDVAIVDALVRGNGEGAADEQGDGALFVRRSRLRDTGGTALTESGAGELSAYRTRLTRSNGGAATESGTGGIAFIKSRIAFNEGIGLSEFEEGGVGLQESTLAGSADDGIVERGEGDVGMTLAEVVGSDGAGAIETDDGGVLLTRSRIARNLGVGLQADGDVTGFATRVLRNESGISIGSGHLTLRRSAVGGSETAGGITALGTLVTLRQSTVGNNESGALGGGVALEVGSELDALNSTIAENRSSLGGGGIYVGPGANAHLNAVTVSHNGVTTGRAGAGIQFAAGATGTIENSVLAADRSVAHGGDCLGFGGVVSGGGNLVGSASGCGNLGGGADRTSINPRLGPLERNGGPTATVALLRRSPAIGAAGGNAPRRDQRNLSRSDPDAGAYERLRSKPR
jgi:hypothetical protein